MLSSSAMRTWESQNALFVPGHYDYDADLLHFPKLGEQGAGSGASGVVQFQR